ncbi:MAG: TonB-dependent receptor [Acidobacteriota bacterium]
MAVLLFAWPIAAQDQRGTVEGVVKDSSGAVLPGVTVEARSGGGGVLSATTDSNGSYRFPSLLPGIYELSANLGSFKPAKIANVEVKLGSIKSVDFALQLASVNEQVTVTAEAPLVDVKSSGRSTSIRAEQVELLPHDRNFLSLVTQAPGANNEPKSNGIMIDGAAAAENRYVIDGIETTDIVGGLSGKNLLADFVEEVQVKSTGYSAEFGGATGGVINVQTKSGTNKMTGTLTTFYQGSNTAGAPNQTIRAVFGVPTQAEYHTYPKDDTKRYETGGSLGGPIMKNNAWFFGAYQPSNTKITRVVNAQTSGIANATSSSTVQKQQVQYASVNGTNQFGNKLRTRVAFNNSWSKTDGQLASLIGSDPASTVYTKGTKFPNWAVSGTADYTVGSNLVISGRVGRFLSDKNDFNVNDIVKFVFANSSTNVGLAGVPASEQHAAGYTNIGSNNGIAFDKTTRNYAQIDATLYGHLAGSHTVKGGFQIDRRGNDVINGGLENTVNLNWDQNLNGARGQFGYYDVVSTGPTSYQTGFATAGKVKSNVNGIFIQDAWSVNNRLTINAGLRTENENVPAYSNAEGVPANPIKFGWKDKTAPRVGVAYDVAGNGKTKAYGSWGIFYDIFKLNLPRGSFGGDKWTSYYFSLDTPNFETLRDSANCPPACPGTALGSVDFRAPSVTAGLDVEQPGQLKPMRTQELSFGLEQQLNSVMAVSVRFVHKQLDRAIDDIGDLDAGNEAYIIANPGEGLVESFDISTGTSVFLPQEPGGVFPSNAVLINMPKATRNYNSLEFALDKRLADRWMLHTSYTWSRDAGNYSGLSSSDEITASTGLARDNPNNSRDFDYPAMSFDQTGHVLDGVFDTDRTHRIKAQFLYLTKWGTSIGLNEDIASGTPITRQVPIISPDNYPIRYKGRGSEGRTPVYSQSDLFVQHSFKIGGTRAIQVSANVLNLFNQRTVTSRVGLMRRGGGIPLGPGYYNEADFYAGKLDFDQLISKAVAAGLMTLNPQFGMDNAYQAPLQAGFGVRFSF